MQGDTVKQDGRLAIVQGGALTCLASKRPTPKLTFRIQNTLALTKVQWQETCSSYWEENCVHEP
jgi:hypothetical protein